MDYNRWKTIRSMMLTSPVEAQELLATYGNDVKMCVYQSHIHGNEYEAVDSNMQVIRDLTVTPRGVNPTVDKILDNEIVVVLMDNNPDGRVNGTRGNPTGLDPNRDFFVQSQPEQKIAVAYMHRWLPTAFIEGHGYYTPTLIDGVTIPHNPGIEEDTYQHWNVQRIEQNRADFAATGVTGLTTIQSPIRDWNETGGTSTRNYTMAGTPYIIAAGPSGIANTAGGGASEVGNTVTITTSSAHNLAVGHTVVISGVGVTGYNGTWTVDSIVSSTKFTYTNPTSGLDSLRRRHGRVLRHQRRQRIGHHGHDHDHHRHHPCRRRHRQHLRRKRGRLQRDLHGGVDRVSDAVHVYQPDVRTRELGRRGRHQSLRRADGHRRH